MTASDGERAMGMIPVICPGCSRALNVSDQFAGLLVKCPKCQNPVSVPGASPAQQPGVPVQVRIQIPGRTKTSGRRSRQPTGLIVALGAVCAVSLVAAAVLLVTNDDSDPEAAPAVAIEPDIPASAPVKSAPAARPVQAAPESVPTRKPKPQPTQTPARHQPRSQPSQPPVQQPKPRAHRTDQPNNAPTRDLDEQFKKTEFALLTSEEQVLVREIEGILAKEGMKGLGWRDIQFALNGSGRLFLADKLREAAKKSLGDLDADDLAKKLQVDIESQIYLRSLDPFEIAALDRLADKLLDETYPLSDEELLEARREPLLRQLLIQYAKRNQ